MHVPRRNDGIDSHNRELPSIPRPRTQSQSVSSPRIILVSRKIWDYSDSHPFKLRTPSRHFLNLLF